MAINKQIQFLRNTNKIYTSRTEAVNAIETLVTGASTKGKILDGQPILARYKNSDGKVKTVSASVYKDSNGATQVTYYDENVDEVYVGSGTPPSTAKLAIDPTEDIMSIVQTTGTSTTSVMSQKAISDSLSKKADLTNSKQTIRADVTWTNNIYLGDEAYELSFNNNGDLTYNGDKVMVGQTVSNEVSLVQNTGQFTTSVMSQKAVSDALSNVYTKAESDAMYLRGEVLYEDYYYPNMGETTDNVNFTDSTEILQPTNFIESYTDADGTTWDNVFECEKFPDWFDFSEVECYPYGNGNSTAYLFFHNFTVDNNELIYDFDSLQNNNIGQKLPYFADINGLGLKKIDATHFKVYTTKEGTREFTAMNKENVDCSLFAFSPVTYNPIYDVDDCKLVRITLTGNIKSPSRYSTLLVGSCDVGLFGYNNRQVLYGDEYVEIEIDKNNNRWRQVKSGYSMFYRSGYSQNWSANKPESYESECRCLWSNIPNGTVAKICMINNKVCYAFTHWSNPLTILQMGCKIKIEKLA